MYITRCCAYPSFRTKIIDSHTHIGNFEGKYYDLGHLEPFMNTLPNGDKVEKMIVSDIDVLLGIGNQKDRTEYLLKHISDTNKYALLASCNVKEDVNTMRTLIESNKDRFVGLKFHPHLQDLPITDKKYESYFKIATDLKKPCLIHTAVSLAEDGTLSGATEKFADPKSVYAVAKNYKDTPFVLAHLGAGAGEAHKYTTDIIIESIKKGDANLYADISWVDIDANKGNKDNILNAIKRLKGIGEENWSHGDQSFRLMFGSDAPISRFADEKNRINSYNNFIEEIKTAIKNDPDLGADSEKIIDDLFYNNAKKLYNLKENTPMQGPSFLSKHKSKLAIGAGVLATLGASYIYYKNDNNKNKSNLSLVG